MFYIYADGKSIFQPMDNSLSLFAPKLTLEMGKAGALSFQIPPSNRYYNALPQLTTMITVEMDDVEIFRGRVLTNNRNFNNVRTVYCEGDLAYLVDTVQKAERYNGKTHDLFRKIIEAHNKRAGADKQFLVGDITIENRDVVLSGKSDEVQDEETGKFDYKQIAINSIADEWQNSFDFIQNCLIDYTGGYLRTRRQNGKTYIDLLLDYGNTATQDIEFGKNMLDLTEEVSAEDVFTVLIPLGDENLTIESVNNGSDELVDATAVERYGRIVKTHVFDSVNTPETLLENGRRFLASNVNVPVTLTVKAVDMHLVDPNASPIYVGDKVHVISAAHGMADELVCTKIEYDLENPANNTYTFGTPKQSLTERYRKDKAKQDAEQTRGGGGGGGGAGEAASEEAKKTLDEFFDAWINVDKEAAHIDLGTLYKKFKDSVEILESSCGISMDAPTGNINIKTLRQEFDDMGTKLAEQSAYIDLLNNDLGARISLVASQHQELADLEAGHYAEMTVSANDQESKIAANTESIRNLNGQMTESRTSITQLSNDLQAQIALEAEHKKTLDSQISTTKTSIQQVADDLKAQITLEASHHSDQGTTIASISAKANKNESSIRLKANKTYVDSEILTVTGKIEAAEAKIITMEAVEAKIKSIVASDIEAVKADISWLEAKSIVLKVGVYAPYVRASKELTVGGKTAATQEWTNTKLADYATQKWVTDKGYLTGIPSTCNAATGFYAPYIRATTGMSVGGKAVATQAWVEEKLASYSKTDHTHSGYASSNHSHTWSAITDKPSTFKPSSHKHSFSFNISHTHSYTKPKSGGTSANTGGMSKNYNVSGSTASN